MEALLDRDIRASFVNCSRGEAARAHLPEDLGERPWDDLDFLGWVDPKAPQTGYLVAPTDKGPVGLVLRRNRGGAGGARMCDLCLTTHSGSGVSLMVARRAGKAGRDGNSVGLGICAGLECSLYARGVLAPPAVSAAHETLPVEARVARLRRNLAAFLGRVTR